VVAIVTVIGASGASAQSLSALKAAVSLNNQTTSQLLKSPNINQSAAEAAGMSAATARALHYQAEVAQALSLAQQAQNAARMAVLGTSGGVPDGLVIGGLQEVPDPLRAAQDPTGTSTWQGASQPTETTSGGKVTVNIKQTASRAILSWETFNVGQNTTVNFDQSLNGTAEPSWSVLNRIVGTSTSPAQIMGSIKAQGQVLIIDPNGILFGGASQVNVNSLIATNLEVGHAFDPNNNDVPLTIKDRNDDFLVFGLLGYADQAPSNLSSLFTTTFSALGINFAQDSYVAPQGVVEVQAGANIQANAGGSVLLTGSKVINAGQIAAPEGQVSLEAGWFITLDRSTGAKHSATPNIRGFSLSSFDDPNAAGSYVENLADGIISAPQGYVSLMSNLHGAVINDGILEATTSVSRNGFIQLDGGDVELGAGSTLAIGPDSTGETIPQDPVSLADYKPSAISIGDTFSRVEVQHDAMIYAPSGNVTIGEAPGPTTTQDDQGNDSRVFIDTGAVIDVAGLPGIVVPASRNSIAINPVTLNDLQDAGKAYKDGFLNGATIYVDPRLSGVRSDGVAWVGSPLIPAASYARQVGVTVEELMTKGGNVSLGAQSFEQGGNQNLVDDVTVKAGAIIDLTGGWVTYQAGWVQTTELIDATGNIVNIGDANPNDTYIGVYNGFTAIQARWGVAQTFADPLLSGRQYEGQYNEGRDAGSLTLKGSSIVLDGTVYAQAFPGAVQLADAQRGTGTSGVYGDGRLVQGAPSQLPSGGFLFVQALGTDSNNSDQVDGGGDIDVVDQADYQPLSSNLAYGQSVYVDSNGNLVIPTRDPASYLPLDRVQTISLSADALSASGISDLALATSGEVNVEKGANLNLAPGGAFDVVAGRTITIDGKVSIPSGSINLQTVSLYGSGDTIQGGSVFVNETAQLGSYDIVVNGTLSTRGLWTNDFGALPGQLLGDAYTSGGSVTLNAAPSVLLYGENSDQEVNEDISGSILVNSGALIDVSGGGYVAPDGALNLTARGGNVSLLNETNFFQTSAASQFEQSGIPGFRVTTIDLNGQDYVPSNPDVINAKVSIAPGTILAAGFGGGGTFTLDTPEISFGDGTASSGTVLSLDFFSTAGCANYDITSYETELLPNDFTNGLGGYNAVLATQVLTIGAGQTLDLTQSYFALDLANPAIAAQQTAALRGLASGGDIYSILKPTVPGDAWDRKAVNLTLGGAVELQVAKGGTLIDEAGGVLTVSQLDNEGTIRMPGGSINQSETLPAIFGSNATSVGAHSLSDIFTTNADGSIDESALDAKAFALNYTCNGVECTNAQFASTYDIYLLGTLDAGEGIHLGAGSVTDLSGTSIRDPYATAHGQHDFVTGRLYAGGTLASQPTMLGTSPLFEKTIGVAVYGTNNSFANDPIGISLAETVTADPGSVLNLSGASDTYDVLGMGGVYTPTREWSNAGTLDLGSGGTLTGATILAQGGAPDALGGTLIIKDPIFYQNDPSTPTLDAVSQAMIASSGFATLVAQGSITSEGDATISLSRGFFLTSLPYDGQTTPDSSNDTYVPVISSGGNLTIDAPYIGLDSIVQSIQTMIPGEGPNSVTFHADDIDIMGAVLFDNSVGNVTLDASGDVRLIGVQPPDITLGINGSNTSNTLQGQLAVNGNLTIDAAQVYPTTGSTFYITSTAADGTITFGRMTADAPPPPYSAGADLTIQAANIVQDGVIRVPVGSLTIGSDTPLMLTTNGVETTFAPATTSVVAGAGSITSVSADGLLIPYGTTTDQTEWYFSPTGSSQLTAPPEAILHFGGNSVSIATGATVDLTGGGDLYAYEFIPGTGGSRDVLDRFNTDEFSGNGGYQYPGGMQVYAIVPGLSSSGVAAYDPIYSANYADLYAPGSAGQSVYLTGSPGLAAGWYTLLPAQYATLPGGMRIVEDTSAGAVSPGTAERLSDGTELVSGYFGVAGTGSRDSTVHAFELQTRNVYGQYSEIALTSADQYFPALAAKNGDTTPRLPIDAGRLILAPSQDLSIGGTFLTAPAEGGRGSEVDITGADFDIVSTLGDAPPDDGAIVLTASSLTDLNASSLLIGGVRTDNPDGTTTLDVTAQSIVVENDSAHPLSAPEVLLAVDGSSANITLADGATITATGKSSGSLTGDYVIDGSSPSALVRVANAPQRLVSGADVTGGVLSVGAVELSGNAVLLDSSGDLTIAPSATLDANALALGAGEVTFTSDGEGLSGLVVTPQLQALFSKADELTITSPEAIAFSSGTYDFGNIHFDSPGFSLFDGNSVTIDAQTLVLSNGNSAEAACGQSGAPVCGDGKLTIAAKEIDFGYGTINTYGFGQAVTLAATTGMFVQGRSAFDFGGATLDIDTPFLGDRAVALAPGQNAGIPSLTLTTTGDVTIADPTGATVPDVAGTPGASLSISGNSISVTDTELRATAGSLTLDSATGITLAGTAALETPSYARTFGDSADPTSVSAPGGTLSLIAQDGDIDAGTQTLLSIGGSQGSAGTLSLSATKGNFNLDGTIDASAPSGGGSLTLDTGAGFDLSAFANSWAKDFTNSIDIHSAAGNLVLAAGDSLDAQRVSLTADGGIVDIAGTIDVSGISGGTVDLYGIDGVTLESSALIDAHANGYGRLDPRQAHGGVVTIGTDDTGAVVVKSGAVIDVAALQTEARLVPMVLNGTTYYIYVPGDVGGSVNFRLPVIQTSDGETVNMTYAGNIEGASSIVLEGFEHFDLAEIADDPNFVGVTINADGQAVLDVSATGTDGQVNFLADDASGTLVNFIQGFDVSSDYGNLGNLTSSPVFHARPGVELDYSGDIVLNSNWNFGAGTVDVQAAVRAGLMFPTVPGCTTDCQYYVVPGDEGVIFSKYTTLTYRVGGSVLGEPGILTMRAGGDLYINGSITDGFFQFGDQTDPNYLNVALGGGNRYYTPYVNPSCFPSPNCSGLVDWEQGESLSEYVDFAFEKQFAGFLDNPVPYSAAANSPAALGSEANNAGDALGSMQLFPLVDGSKAVSSWSYQLVAGADLTGAQGGPSADPLHTVAGSSGSVIVQGLDTYTYSATAGTSQFVDQLDFQVGSQFLTADSWYMTFLTENPGSDAASYTYIDFSSAPSAVQELLFDPNTGLADAFLKEFQGDFQIVKNKQGDATGITTTLNLSNQFMLDVIEPNFSQILQAGNYKAPASSDTKKPVTAQYTTLVRTGTGSIDIAAAEEINLQNGAVTYENLDGTPSTEDQGGFQLGGAPVYTAGHIADLGPQTVVDELTGQTFTIDPSAYDDTSNVFSQPINGGYQYGGQPKNGSQNIGFAGILIANPVYATGGGNVSLTAGQDVLSRRDVWGEERLAQNFNNFSTFYNWIGSADQAWRSGSVGALTNILINPQLFSEGVGALGGGDISVIAGRNIVDLTVADDTSVTTAAVTSQSGTTPSTLGLWQFGGGNVYMDAGAALLGGRIDVGEGSANIFAGNIESAGDIQVGYYSGQPTMMPDTLRLRLSDATISLSTTGSADIEGIGALGVYDENSRSPSDQNEENLDAHGLYSSSAGVSIVADGSVSIDDQSVHMPPNAIIPVFDLSIDTVSDTVTGNISSAVYPGSLNVASLTGSLDLVGAPNSSNAAQASQIVLFPSPVGQLNLFAAADIAPVTIDMEDGDPGLLPGAFSTFTVGENANGTLVTLTGRAFSFPAVLPNTTQVELATYHNSTLTHLGDPQPVRIDAGGDIVDMILSIPKQARIWAGRDIINMMFFGQNLSPSDITRIVAGRDIIATTSLVRPVSLNEQGQTVFGQPEPALDGNSFVIGGPGSFFLEAGRDAGPFLNSSDTNGVDTNSSGSAQPSGAASYGGGILSVGNDWNPFLPATGANLYVEFGVGKGANFDGFRNYYLDPSNFGNLPGYLFVQTNNGTGNLVPDRTQPIYGPVLIQWMQTNVAAALETTYGTTQVTYQQAYTVFTALPELEQRVFLLDNIYFNELTQTSIPTSLSYKVYSRGYTAVNLLFPASLGYTQNDLSGGSNGANDLVDTGNLDLRLSAIETTRGGNVYILGPGGRVLAGSTVATADQAARHSYIGGQLFAGVNLANGTFNCSVEAGVPCASVITDIPPGYEGILTLRGGSIDTFTDQDFLLNQSRLFTEDGGNIAMWSSNADLNAGQGPKTSSDFPPVVVEVDDDVYAQTDSIGGVTGAGIAAFQPAPGIAAPDVFLIAPRGTVDAGSAGVRVAGNLFVAAFSVANASNFSVGGTAVGVPGSAAVNVSAQTGASSSAAAASQAAQAAANASGGNGSDESVITVDVLGYAGTDGDDEKRKRKRMNP
jgi:filamentous hemagglutinin family protein